MSLKNYAYTTYSLLAKPLVVRNTPIHIHVEPTTYCNLRCKFCEITSIKRPCHLRLSQYKHVYDRIRPLKVSLVGLGETLLNPDAIRIIRYTKEQGSQIVTTSNGTLLTREVSRQLVESGLDLVKISLDGATKETYREIRGRDCFDMVVENIRVLSEEKQKARSKTPYLRLNLVINRLNLPELGDYLVIAKRLGVDAVFFKLMYITPANEPCRILMEDVSPQEVGKRLLGAQKVAADIKLATNVPDVLKRIPYRWRDYDQRWNAPKENRICLLPWFSCYIRADGRVQPCCSCHTEGEDFGNLLTQDFNEIWNGVRIQRFRQRSRAGDLPYYICRGCKPYGIGEMLRLPHVDPGYFKFDAHRPFL